MKKLLQVVAVAGCSLFAIAVSAQKSPKVFGQSIPHEHIDTETNLVRCGSTQYENYLKANNSKRASEAEFENWLSPLVEQQRLRNMTQSQANGIITIPVVVHVIHGGQPVGTAPNIVDAQVQSQITVLNQDYRRMAGTPGFNTHAAGADTQIQFALAQQDPNGFPTNGINRVNFCKSSFSESEIEQDVKPYTIWDPTQYLNIWVVGFGGDLADVLGYAQFPSNSGLSGLNTNGGSMYTDGVAISYKYFGSIAHNNGSFILEAPFNRGRTASHEVGHYLGLRHIWGDGNCGNDFCADTPRHHTANYSCNTTITNCDNNGYEMVQNYMDYTNDSCMNIFTADQKLRMQTVLNNATRRATLKTSTKDQPMTLFANDAALKASAVCSNSSNLDCSSTASAGTEVKLDLTNHGTATLTSAVITISANGQTISHTYTGNLATYAMAQVTIPVTFAGPYTYNVTTVNGVADQRPANNQGSSTGNATPTVPSYDESNFVFQLTTDRYGSETTWHVKNSAGTTLYSGGPYTNNLGFGFTPTAQTFNLFLPANDCYTLTILDSEDDGICCGYGSGGYLLRTASGQILVPFSGSGSFGASASKTFRVSALSTSTFEQTAVYLYPNPGSDVVAIRMSSAFEDVQVRAFTVLGQNVPVQLANANDELVLQTASWANGVYFIQVQVGENMKTLRFVKQ